LQGVKQIKEIAGSLERMERDCGVQLEGHDALNFGLVQVVYEWAQGKVSLIIIF
jgi:hypothetical protein